MLGRGLEWEFELWIWEFVGVVEPWFGVTEGLSLFWSITESPRAGNIIGYGDGQALRKDTGTDELLLFV